MRSYASVAVSARRNAPCAYTPCANHFMALSAAKCAVRVHAVREPFHGARVRAMLAPFHYAR
eukprot:10833217-Lingulodinium_polyedra.AAC.1